MYVYIYFYDETHIMYKNKIRDAREIDHKYTIKYIFNFRDKLNLKCTF